MQRWLILAASAALLWGCSGSDDDDSAVGDDDIVGDDDDATAGDDDDTVGDDDDVADDDDATAATVDAHVVTAEVTWTLDFDAEAEAEGYTDCEYTRTYEGVQFLDQPYLCAGCTIQLAGTAEMIAGYETCYEPTFGGDQDRTEYWGFGWPENDGGAAVQINGGVGVVFEDCLFEENYSSDPIDPDDVIYGGALGAFHADLEMIGCAFRDNAVSGSDSRGGGVAAVGGTLRLYGCTFVGNAAGKSGGGLLASGSLDMRDCRLFGNYASLGGGMFATGALQMSNSVLSGNRALDFGAGIYFGPVGVPDGILHCTITRNHAYGAGAGIFSASPIPVPLLNSIVRDNSAANENDDLATQLFALAAPFDVSYSCVQGIAETKGNIDQDPMFFDPEGADGWEGTEDDDLRLAPCSPAVDAGNSEILPDSLTADLDGLARAVDVDESFAPDTGLGFPVADMGAYEHPMAGDLDGNDSVDVVDVQCAILTMWWHYYGAVGPPPDCVLQSAYADMDGNGGIDLIDVYRIIYLMHGYKPGC